MTTSLACLSEFEHHLLDLVAEVLARHRSHLRELWLVVSGDGLRLCGLATCYYGKQIAFHELCCRCKLTIVSNEIEVLPA